MQTSEIREVQDKIRFQCLESTNSIAYRIHAVIDAADIDYPDREIE